MATHKNAFMFGSVLPAQTVTGDSDAPELKSLPCGSGPRPSQAEYGSLAVTAVLAAELAAACGPGVARCLSGLTRKLKLQAPAGPPGPG